MKKIKHLLLSLFLFGLLSYAGTAWAGPLMDTVNNGGLKNIGEKAYTSSDSSVIDPRVMIARIVSKVLGFLGIIMVVLIIYSGFQWMTAEGDKGKIDAAKKRIQNTVIGLIIILSSYAVTNFIIECSSYATERGAIGNLLCQ
jgi:type IV secretory pathway VirB2 component (pilin)